MAGRIAIDFGTSNTVVAVWDAAAESGKTFFLSEYGRELTLPSSSIAIIPSLIHYAPNDQQWIGQQVIQKQRYHAKTTFRAMKRHIGNRSPVQINCHGQTISHFDAGHTFLSNVLLATANQLNLQDEEVVFTVPVEAFEHFESWLSGVADSSGMPRMRLIDEPSAAALGYGTHIQPGDVYLIFDFGGGTLDIAVVLIEEKESAQAGRRCRVLGKAGLDLGGITLDQWLFQAVLQQNNYSIDDPSIHNISNLLLVECEALKERLSFHNTAGLSAVDPDSGRAITAEFSRDDFEEILEENNAFSMIDQTIRRAINAARERGYDEESIQTVLMVGGSSYIPSIQKMLRRIFGKDRVLLNRPLDAVACGAAAFAAGVDFYDHIQHTYAIRYINSNTHQYDYKVLVPRGTPYPSEQPVSRFNIKAAYDQQGQLGLAIFEIAEKPAQQSSNRLELVFDPGGAARLMPVSADQKEKRQYFWMNENNPTFLNADPPAKAGEERFEVTFQIDRNKRLTISVKDLLSGEWTHQEYPVVKLT